MKNKFTTIFGSIAAFAGIVPQVLTQNGVTLAPGVQKWFSLTALVSSIAFAAVAKDKNVTGAGASARVVE